MMTATSDVSKDAAMNIQDDRAADRGAIRAHIDSIFQAFIKKDAAALRATHAQNWLGYLEGSRTMIRGLDGYMDNVYVDPKSPYGMKSVLELFVRAGDRRPANQPGRPRH